MIVLRKGDRMISIDEYIEYLEQCADITKGSDEGDRLSRQLTQLAVWLKELKSQRWLLKDIQDTCEHLYLENIRYRSCLTDDAENARMILEEMSELKADNAELTKRNEELQADVIRLFLNEAGRWIECMQREMEKEPCGLDIEHDAMQPELVRLTDENAKLRELVRELYEDAFSEYPSYFDKTYLSRLAELGVQVNRECTIAWLESEEA